MKRIFRPFFFLLLFISGSYWTLCSGADVTIFFYNPETNANNFATLKSSFDSYLTTKGNYEFQPFDNKENFEKNIRGKNNIYLLSNWQLVSLQQQKVPLHIAMLGVFKGSTKQRKALSARKDIVNFASLKNATVAGAGGEAYIRSILQQINPEKYKELASSIKILSVPKDIDALMAVGFDQANAAVAAESSLKTLEKSNANQYEKLHNLGYSEKGYLLVAATLEKPGKKEAQALDVLYNMSFEETSQNTLNLLGLDGWERK